MPVPCTRLATLLIAAALSGLTNASAIAQQETARVTVDAPGIVSTIRTNRPVVSSMPPPGLTVPVLGLGRNTHGLTGPIEEMEESGANGKPPASAFSDSGSGLSTTFFIQHVPEGTTRFLPLARPGTALVDTWTEQVMEGEAPQSAPRSPVTIWTGTVHGDSPAKP